MDHSDVVDTILAPSFETLLKDRLIRLTLQRVRKLQEQAAVSDDLVTRFQPTGNLRLTIQTFS